MPLILALITDVSSSFIVEDGSYLGVPQLFV